MSALGSCRRVSLARSHQKARIGGPLAQLYRCQITKFFIFKPSILSRPSQGKGTGWFSLEVFHNLQNQRSSMPA
jgi:hypothetical protein